MTDLSPRQRGRPTKTEEQLSNSNKHLTMSPRGSSTPRHRVTGCQSERDSHYESLVLSRGGGVNRKGPQCLGGGDILFLWDINTEPGSAGY
jgi:hypothetical protein